MPEEFYRDKPIYRLCDFARMSSDPQPYLLEHLIFANKGRTILVGKPKLGKSWLAIKIGISIAQNKKLLGLSVTAARVLYLDFDRRFLKNTIDNLSLDLSGDLFIIQPDPVAFNELGGLNYLSGIVEKIAPKLVIVDHKSACFSGKENDDDPNRKWVNNFSTVASKYKISFLVVAQAPKGWSGQPGETVDLPFGSRIFTAWADTIIGISKKGQNYRMLEVESNYEGISPIVYDKEFNVVPVEVDTDKQAEAKGKVLARWSECKYPNTAKVIEEVSKELGCSFATTWRAYREIKEDKTREKIAKAKETEK